MLKKVISTSRVEQSHLWPVERENHYDSISAAQRGKSTSEFKILREKRRLYSFIDETEIKLTFLKLFFSRWLCKPCKPLVLLSCLYFRSFSPLQPSHFILSFDFHMEGNRYLSDGTHQCSAYAVKLSVADRLTDTVNPSITTTESRLGRRGKRCRAKEMHRVKNERKQVHLESHVLFFFLLWAQIKSGTALKP